MKRLLLSCTLGLLGALTLTACAKGQTCEDLTAKLCAAHPDRCAEAGPFVASQSAASTDADAAQKACALVLGTDQAFAAYSQAFASTQAAPTAVVAPAPVPVSGQPSAPAPAPAKTAAPKPTTQEQIKTVGDNIEEVGKTGEKAGEAIDKIGGAFDNK